MIGEWFRKLPPFKGKRRLARILLRKEIAAANKVMTGKYNCQYRIPNFRENIGFEILVNGIYEESTIDFIVEMLPEGKCLVDIGANIGAVSVPVAMRRPDIAVIAVEAAPWIFTYLSENVHLNKLSNFTLINKAVSEAGGGKVNFYSPREKFGKGSLAPVFESDGVEVGTITLDELVTQQVSLIKIDIEGFEYFAFLGGEKLLKGMNAPDILFEFVDWAEKEALHGKSGMAQALLMEWGYSIFYFEGGKCSRRLTKPETEGSHMFFATRKRIGSAL